MAMVLCTGVDSMLLETRKMILERAGHTVISADEQAMVIALCKQRSFDVAVIGQSVSPGSKRSIASMIRLHCPKAKILELYPPHQGKALEDADSWLEVPADLPGELAERVSVLASLKQQRHMSA